MTDTTAKPAKATKSAKSKVPSSHPKYEDMVVSAIKEMQHKGGSSKVAIVKYITSHYKVGDNEKTVNCNVKLALKRGVAKESLAQSKGTGATGSFRVGKAESAKSKKVKKPQGAKKPTKKPTKKTTAKSPKAKAVRTVKSPKPKVLKPKKAAAKKVKKPIKPKTNIKKPATKKASKK